MTIRIGNAPCSWGVEFAQDPRNPAWQTVLKECAEAGYQGIELGPIGFMPEDPAVLGPALAEARPSRRLIPSDRRDRTGSRSGPLRKGGTRVVGPTLQAPRNTGLRLARKASKPSR